MPAGQAGNTFPAGRVSVVGRDTVLPLPGMGQIVGDLGKKEGCFIMVWGLNGVGSALWLRVS